MALSQHSSPTRTPLDILKERFARGEIDKEEFEERRRVLARVIDAPRLTSSWFF